MLYQILGAPYPYTLLETAPEIAEAAVIRLHQENLFLEDEREEKIVPPWPFEDLARWYQERHGISLSSVMTHRRPEIIRALEAIEPGSSEERRLLQESIARIRAEHGILNYLASWRLCHHLNCPEKTPLDVLARRIAEVYRRHTSASSTGAEEGAQP